MKDTVKARTAGAALLLLAAGAAAESVNVTAVVANLSSAITIEEPAEPAAALPFNVSAAMPADLPVATATDANATDVACPPEGLEPLPGSELNLNTWAAAPWFPLWQMPLAYQNPDQLYCVRASYLLQDERTVRVFNTAQEGSVDGPQQNDGERMPYLKAIIPDPEETSKLMVGPPFLPEAFYGDYWVYGAGVWSDDGQPVPSETGETYDWGIVSGGPPTTAQADGCTAGQPGQFNGAGLWLFSRDPLLDDARKEALFAYVQGLGFATSTLLPTVQEGCSYPPIPPAK
jgi:lipocalin